MAWLFKIIGGVGLKSWFIIGAILAALAYVGYLNYSISSLEDRVVEKRKEIADLNNENDILRVRVKSWTDAYHELTALANKCNDAVKELEKTSANLQDKAAEAIDRAKREAKAIQIQIDAIGVRPANPEGGCTASIELVRSDLRELP